MFPPLVFAMFLVTMSARILGEGFLPLEASDSSGRVQFALCNLQMATISEDCVRLGRVWVQHDV